MSSPLSTAMFIVYNIESIPSNVSRVVSTKYLHCGEKNALHCKNVYVWRFLCLCPCITVWVEKGHYLAKKSVMQVCGLPNERCLAWSDAECPVPGQHEASDGATVPTFVHGEGALLAHGLRHAVP